MAGRLGGRPFRFARAAFTGLFRVLLRFHVEGAERVPREGGVLVVSNHLHNADPLLMCVAFPRPLHYMAKKELMSVPVIGRLIRFAGAFPVDRGRADRQAIQQAGSRLEQGIAVGMFPEGTRSVSRRIERVLPGAGLIALRGNAPIVPAAIWGSERLPFNGAKQVRDHGGGRGVTIRFGEPFTLEPKADGKRLTSEEAIDEAMRRVADLLPEAYRGIYGQDRATIETSRHGAP